MVCQIPDVKDIDMIDNDENHETESEMDPDQQQTICGAKFTISDYGEKTSGRVYIIPPPHLVAGGIEM